MPRWRDGVVTTLFTNHGLSAAASREPNPQDAAHALALALCHEHAGFVLFFCSAEYPLSQLADALCQAFGELGHGKSGFF